VVSQYFLLANIKPEDAFVTKGFYSGSRLKKWGMDSYLYAPKDDYKHRAYWRELYTVEEAEHLTGLQIILFFMQVIKMRVLLYGVSWCGNRLLLGGNVHLIHYWFGGCQH
jgi:hypothetical protein